LHFFTFIISFIYDWLIDWLIDWLRTVNKLWWSFSIHGLSRHFWKVTFFLKYKFWILKLSLSRFIWRGQNHRGGEGWWLENTPSPPSILYNNMDWSMVQNTERVSCQIFNIIYLCLRTFTVLSVVKSSFKALNWSCSCFHKLGI